MAFDIRDHIRHRTAHARGVYSILAMKQLDSFAGLGNRKMQFLTLWGNIVLEFYNDIELCGMSILGLFKFFHLAEV